MRRIFEFLCQEGHVSESFVDDSVRLAPCKDCGKDAERIVSRSNFKLEGVTGDFPGAYSRWERVRAEKLKEERKKAASHGE
jgi:hypothetical protein